MTSESFRERFSEAQKIAPWALRMDELAKLMIEDPVQYVEMAHEEVVRSA